MAERVHKIGVLALDIPDTPETNPLVRIRYPLGLYAQTLAHIGAMDDPEVRASAAWVMDRYWRERGSLNALKTLHLVNASFRVLTPLFPDLSQQGEIVLGKQQPSMAESTRATLRRLDFLNRYVRHLPPNHLSVISGGSMSYGRFFNVREGNDPSDIDLLVIYEEGRLESVSASDLLPPKLDFTQEEIAYLHERLRLFKELQRLHQADVLSHKTNVPAQGFQMSMHLLSAATFEDIMVHSPNSDLKNGVREIERKIQDYKPVPYKYKEVELHDFNGEAHFYNVDEQPIVDGVGSDEVITQIPIYAIEGGKFIPGLYHNLVSPRFEIEAFSAREAVAAATLFWTMMRRLETEYKSHNPNASALKSHIRHTIFNPRLIEDHAMKIAYPRNPR